MNDGEGNGESAYFAKLRSTFKVKSNVTSHAGTPLHSIGDFWPLEASAGQYLFPAGLVGLLGPAPVILLAQICKNP